MPEYKIICPICDKEHNLENIRIRGDRSIEIVLDYSCMCYYDEDKRLEHAQELDVANTRIEELESEIEDQDENEDTITTLKEEVIELKKKVSYLKDRNGELNHRIERLMFKNK